MSETEIVESSDVPMCYGELVIVGLNDGNTEEASENFHNDLNRAYRKIKEKVESQKLVLLSTRQEERILVDELGSYLLVAITAHVMTQDDLAAFQRRQQLAGSPNARPRGMN